MKSNQILELNTNKYLFQRQQQVVKNKDKKAVAAGSLQKKIYKFKHT